MACAPLVGVVLGGLAAGVGAGLAAAGAGALLASAGVVAALAALTRGLHLDGLADVADGLGSGKPPAEARRIMKASDIGPFGVLVLLLATLAQIAALARAFDAGTDAGAAGAVLAAVAGRCALPRGCAVGTPSARPEGLGAAVAGTVGPAARWGGLLLSAAALAALGSAAHGWVGAVGAVAALGVGIACATGLLTHCLRRFEGITGDVLGAMVETSATGALVVWAVATAH